MNDARQADTARTSLVPAVFRSNPDYLLLWSATLISGLGSLMTVIALPLIAWDRTGSIVAFAAIMSSGTAGTLLMTLAGGAFADRWDRRKLLLTGDVLLLLGIAAMGIAVAANAWAACAGIAFFEAAVTAAFRAASPALQRDIVSDEHRVSANALSQVSICTVSLVAPLLGVALYSLVGFTWIVVADAATFAVSFALVARLRDPLAMKRTTVPATTVITASRNVLREVRYGISVGIRDPYTRPEIMAAMLSGIGNGMFIVAVVPWLDSTLHLPSVALGVVIAIVGLSGIVASVLVARRGPEVRPAGLIQLGVASGMVGSIAFLGAPPVWLLVLCLLSFGVSNVVGSIGATTITQRRFPSQVQGRLGSLHQLGFQGFSLMGTLAAAVIAARFGTQAPITTFAICIIAAQALFLLALRGSRRPVSAALAAQLAAEEAEPASPVGEPHAGLVEVAVSEGKLVTHA